MSLLDYFRSNKKQNTAQLAKERLQIIVAHERSSRGGPDYLPQLKQDLLDVIRKYVQSTLTRSRSSWTRRVMSCLCWSSTSPSPMTKRDELTPHA